MKRIYLIFLISWRSKIYAFFQINRIHPFPFLFLRTQKSRKKRKFFICKAHQAKASCGTDVIVFEI